MVHFNPRFPWGKRLEAKAQTISLIVFQSTLPVGEATEGIIYNVQVQHISIHASRGGSDKTSQEKNYSGEHFNPRFPWGKRLFPIAAPEIVLPFQSTLPVGEATYSAYMAQRNVGISIHASRGGSDPSGGKIDKSKSDISIHASRGGSDQDVADFLNGLNDFNPRFPWGKRRLQILLQKLLPGISIHASRGGSDHCRCRFLPWPQHFNPRFPWGKRHLFPMIQPEAEIISIHASRGGSDLACTGCFILTAIFQSTLPVGEATWCYITIVRKSALFQSTLPVGEATCSGAES